MNNSLKLLILFFAMFNEFKPSRAANMLTSLASTNIDFIFNGEVNCTFTNADPAWPRSVFLNFPDQNIVGGTCGNWFSIDKNGVATCSLNSSTPTHGNIFATSSGYPVIIYCEATNIGPSTPFSP